MTCDIFPSKFNNLEYVYSTSELKMVNTITLCFFMIKAWYMYLEKQNVLSVP